MAAVPALRALMKSDQGDTGDAAAIALARIAPGSLDCVPRVFAAFESRGNRNAERALVRLGPNAAEIMPRLMEMLHDQDRAWDAIRVIGAIGPAARPAVPWLIQALHDEALGHAARSVLSELGETASEAGPDLIDALRHHHDAFWHRPVSPNVGPYVVEAIRLLCVDLENEESRLEAVERLTAFGSSAVPATQRLRDFTRSTDPDLRMASMEALAAIGLQAETSVPCLAAALSDPDPRIVRTALNSLRNFRHDASIALPQILKVLEQNKISTRDEMTHLLTVMGASAGDAIPILKRQLESSDPRVRIPAATAVHSIQMAAPPVRRRRVW